MLALTYRPKSLQDIVGQPHITSPDTPFYKLLVNEKLQHSFFFGPAGVGKTTIARVIAKELERPFYEKNATTIKVSEIREIFAKHRNALQKPLLFIDEIHRLSKTQQEVLLPFMENYEGLVIGASTENPYFSLTPAIRSRSMLYELKPITNEALSSLLETILQKESIKLDKGSKNFLINSANGDIRSMLNLLQAAVDTGLTIDTKLLKQLRPNAAIIGSSSADAHYDTISALIKSIRGSDIDASLYYLALLIEGGEPPEYIARRLVILSSEDIGNANPNALNLAVATMNAVSKIGYPEARIILSQCVIYLASCPKSNSSYKAINDAVAAIQSGDIEPIPDNIKNFKQGYLYPHDYGGYVEQRYMKKDRKFFDFIPVGFEKTLKEWVQKIRGS
ncbi:MAG: replication-associated recombination protein A [Campylobacterota bacterium]